MSEVETRLVRMFSASKDGYKNSVVERSRLEGFMHAGVFMGLVTNAELASLMDQVHLSIFGKSLQDRAQQSSNQWAENTIDYSQYEQPPYQRNKS
ncbi:MAG: hypothetical protein V7752_13205 [Halopseudomonas sp.]